MVRRRARAALTRRRSSYRSVASLQRDNRVCRACVEAGFALESLPIVLPYTGQRAYVFGQAPGKQEGVERLPWRGRAGRTLRRWLDMDEDEFYATFYCASATRCYPGGSPSGRGDRTPTPREQALCAFWREWEFELMQPQLVVTVGGLAARRLLGARSISECVGVRYERDGYVAIPLPHPSGASGWLNAPANRARVAAAVGVIHGELVRLGLRGAAPA